MIIIKNTQRTIAYNTKKLMHDVKKIMRYLGYETFDIGIWLTTNKTIRFYNRKYRKKDKPTDILSFPYHPHIHAGETIIAHSPEDKNIGDLIISMQYVKKAAQELGVSLEKRMQILIVHGICHLLGYDHELDADYEIMHAKETEILKQLQKTP
jgi:probable rRNA maturation factor